jgi:ribosomal protein S19
MVKGSSGLTIRTRICNMSSRQRAQETCARDIGILPRMVGEQRRVAGKYHQ